MCKYCMWRTVRENIGEKTNGYQKVTTLKDGSQIFEVGITRYHCESEKKSAGHLMVAMDVDLGDGSTVTVKTKNIKIKYCPFCGEEL